MSNARKPYRPVSIPTIYAEGCYPTLDVSALTADEAIEALNAVIQPRPHQWVSSDFETELLRASLALVIAVRAGLPADFVEEHAERLYVACVTNPQHGLKGRGLFLRSPRPRTYEPPPPRTPRKKRTTKKTEG